MKHLGISTLLLSLSAGAALASPVNLSTWIVEENSAQIGPNGNWMVGSGNSNVTQASQSKPSVFYSGGASSQGNSLSGSVIVNDQSDDDFFGFVLGFDAGELDGSASSIDYWLIDWKQATQNFGGFGFAGLALSHVTGSTTDRGDFWRHSGPVNEVQRGATLANTGWADQTTYTFELTFTETLIEVAINGSTEISYTSTDHGSLFEDGGFGFYGFSQPMVTYLGIEQSALGGGGPQAPVPLPASAVLLLAGIAGLCGARRLGRRRV